jgi:DNA-binding IclR family transcriptional regulator
MASLQNTVADDLVTRGNTDASIELLEDCQTIRSQGFAMQASDHQMRHTTAIAAPIVQRGTVVAAIALADREHSRRAVLVALLREWATKYGTE